MKSFKDMGITLSSTSFIGDKIKMDAILNREILVHDYRIEDSTLKPGTKCLWMQIEVDGRKRVLFSGGKGLMQMIQQVDRADFPFKTTIIKENESPLFS